MSDRFYDARTYRKRSTDVKLTEARKAYQKYNNLYETYAKAVNVSVTDALKRLVDDFKSFFEYPAGTRPTGIVKQQWVEYYRTHH